MKSFINTLKNIKTQTWLKISIIIGIISIILVYWVFFTKLTKLKQDIKKELNLKEERIEELEFYILNLKDYQKNKKDYEKNSTDTNRIISDTRIDSLFSKYYY